MSAIAETTSAEIARPPEIRRWTLERKIGNALVGLWIVLGIALVLYLVSSWNYELVTRYFPGYMSGLWVTIKLVVLSVFFGAILSIPICYARLSRPAILQVLSYAYVYFFRGTPLLA